MNKVLDNKIFNLLLIFTIIGEFLVPGILKHFYIGYDSNIMAMSVLGSKESPVRYIYNGWLIWLGIFLIFTAAVFYLDISEVSRGLAILTFLSIAVFAIGAGILAGLFSVNESKDVVTFASDVHGFGSAIGFMTLLFFPLLKAIACFKQKNITGGVICMLAFVMATAFFVCFIMGDKEQFKNTIISNEGLWERLTLLSMYIPFLYQGSFKIIKLN